MTSKIALFIFIFFAAVIQFSILPNVFPDEAGPDILMLLVLFWALKGSFERILGRVILVGLLADIFAFRPVGIGAFSLSLVAFGVSSLAKRFLISHKAWKTFFISAVVAVSVLAYEMFYIFYSALPDFFGGKINLPGAFSLFFSRKTIFKIAYNLVVFALIYWPLTAIEKNLEFYGKRMFGFKK